MGVCVCCFFHFACQAEHVCVLSVSLRWSALSNALAAGGHIGAVATRPLSSDEEQQLLSHLRGSAGELPADFPISGRVALTGTIGVMMFQVLRTELASSSICGEQLTVFPLNLASYAEAHRDLRSRIVQVGDPAP